MPAVVERLDIFDSHRPGEAALVRIGERDADVARPNLGVDGDPLLDRDRVLDAGFEHPNLAIGRAGAGAGEVESDCSAAVTTLELDVGDAGSRLEVAETDDH